MRLPEPGDFFADRYQIEHELGAGGFATVFAATDSRDGTRVALKILRPDAPGRYEGRTSARFRREVAILRQLHDPHTVRLLDNGESSTGLLWVAFEYVAGEDLSSVLHAERTLSVEATTRVIRQILQSLKEAHGLGLLHRDLKPENILVVFGADGSSTIKVLDFGIARAADSGHPSVTKTGELVGTPRYMSPEQLYGTPLGPESDIYAVGLIGVELLMGRDSLHGNALADQLDRLQPGFRFELPRAQPGDPLVPTLRRMLDLRPGHRLTSTDAAFRSLSGGGHSTIPREESTPWALRLGLLSLVIAVVAFALSTFPNSPQESVRIVPRHVERSALIKSTDEPADVFEVDVGTVPAPAICSVEAGEGIRWLTGPSGDRRQVYVYVPKTFDPAEPATVVAVFGDSIESYGPQMLDYVGLRGFADKNNTILVVPPSKSAQNFGFGGIAFGGEWQTSNALGAWRDIAAAKFDLCAETAKVFLVGEARGGEAIEAIVAKGHPVTGIVTSGFRYPADRKPPAFPPVRRLGFFTLRDAEPTSEGEKCRSYPSKLIAMTAQRLKKQHGCTGTESTKRLAHGSCETLRCDVPLTVCEIDGGRNWIPPAWLHTQECVGRAVDFPFSTITQEFLKSSVGR